jgi:hypothetical protein
MMRNTVPVSFETMNLLGGMHHAETGEVDEEIGSSVNDVLENGDKAMGCC